MTKAQMIDAVRVGAGQPHHANAWGAAMLAAAKRGSIRRTMTLRQSGRAEANSHANPVWASLIHEPKGMAIRAEEQLEVW
jgi:DNA-binding IclR family transcriptional regulator